MANLELYQVELTGMCTDTDQQAYTEMVAKFAKKFSSFVELAPLQLNSISELIYSTGLNFKIQFRIISLILKINCIMY